MTFADLSPLANHLWQSTLCVAVAWLLTLALRKNRASVRYGLWLAASVKFLVPFSWLASLGASLHWQGAPVAEASRLPVFAAQIEQPFAMTAPAAFPAAASPAPHLWPAVLLIIWLCGIAVGVVFWIRSARRIGAILRGAQPLDLNLPIPVMAAPGRMEPGVFGISKPALLLPEGIAEHLTPEQLEAILAHELRHVHRRDNLTAAIHMLVETLFWFHPAVWWIRTRLVEERERACDEGVLLSGSEPQVYAESILKVCEFYLSAPVACAAGMTGGELKKRIEGIMENRFGSKLGFGKRALLAMAALVSVLSPLAIGVMHPLHGAQEQAQRLTFEVASFKLAAGQGIFSSRLELHPGRFTWTTQLCYLFGYAYDLEWGRFSSVSGHIPGWGDVYDVAATMSPKATEDQIRLMVRSLLEDRMKMAWHFETKETDGWVLSVANHGPKIDEFKVGDPRPPMPDWAKGADAGALDGQIWGELGEAHVVSLTGRKISMAQLCANLERSLGKVVWDETGLKGNDYVSFRYALDDVPADVSVDAPPLNAALLENLGLQITKRKGQAQYVVVDHIEKTPTEN